MSHDIFDYFTRYPDVPNGAIVKEDLLRLGVNFDESVQSRIDGYLQKQYNLFTSNYNRGATGAQKIFTVPNEIRIFDEQYDILPTVVETRYSAASPYKVYYEGDAFSLYFHDRRIASTLFCKRPPYHDKVFPDGTRYQDVVALVHWGYKVAASVVRYCDYKTDICRFCDINTNFKLRRDGAILNSDPYAKLEYVVPVIKEILESPQIEGSRTLVYGLTGGTVMRENESVEAEIYCKYIRRIKQEVGGRYPVSVTCTARAEDELWMLKEAGLDVYQSNIEIWDQSIFERICPGKARAVGYRTWISLLEKAVDVFGEGNVITNFVAGVEVNSKHGFATIDEGLRSTSSGFDYLMDHGITPKMTSFCASTGCGLKNEPILPLDYYVRIAKSWYDKWRHYCLPPVRNHGPMGPGRAIEINSAYNDIGS